MLARAEVKRNPRRSWSGAYMFGLGAVLACAPLQVEALSKDEQKITAWVEAHNSEAIALLQKVVDIESPTDDPDGVRAVGAVFQSKLEALGLEAQWLEMPAAMHRAGHLVARTRGTKGKRLLLLGHIDTVLRGEKFRREGTKAYGTGIADMKSGAVLMLYALEAMDAAGALDRARVTVILTGDEENPGRPVETAREAMIAAARESDLALSFEATVGNTATVGRRGSSFWKLEVDGKTGHSSQIFKDDMGAGAIFEASRIVDQFYTALHAEKYLTVNPSVVVGGTTADLQETTGSATGKRNVVPARVLITGDLRFISEAQKDGARAKMRDIVGRNLTGTSATITFEDGYPAMTPNDGNDALLAELDRVSRDLGFGPVEPLDPGERGAGDIAFVSSLIPSLDGIGGENGDNSHAPGEWGELGSFAKLTQRAAVLMYRLSR